MQETPSRTYALTSSVRLPGEKNRIANASLKDIAGRLFCAVGIDALFRAINRHRLLILAYHGITREPLDPACSWMVDQTSFALQMKWLARHYRVLRVEDAIALLRSGRNLPDRCAVLTFDDGYASIGSIAMPILLDLHLPATVFLVASTLDAPELLWHDRIYLALMRGNSKELDLREHGGGKFTLGSPAAANVALIEILLFLNAMPVVEKSAVLAFILSKLEYPATECAAADPGAFTLLTGKEAEALLQSSILEAGAHSHHHEILSRLVPESQSEEIRNSVMRLGSLSGARSMPFAYPNGQPGDFDDSIKKLLRDSGFTCAFTAIGGLNDAGEDLFALKRIMIEAGLSPYRFRLRLSGFAEWFRGWLLPQLFSGVTRCRILLRILRRFMREHVWKRKTILLFERARAGTNPAQPEVARLGKLSFVSIGRSDLDSMDAAALGQEPDRFRAVVEERLERGMQCFALKVRDQIAAYIWMDPGPSIYIKEAECHIDMRPRSAYLFDAFTFPQWRGLNLFPQLLLHVCSMYPDMRMLIAAEAGNRPSRRGIEKAAFLPVEERSVTKVAGIRLRRRRCTAFLGSSD
jgi:peptidoglycan/xylan/chitin deacetylase (PgdA/CDA1 family)